MQLFVPVLYVSDGAGASDEKKQVKDMGTKASSKRFESPGCDSEGEACEGGIRLPPAAHPKSLFVAVTGILQRLSPRA